MAFSTPFRRLWYAWKALNLPWRKKYLAGTDLVGNTYWEAKPDAYSARPRRMIRAPRRIHHADVQVSPQWHQWLRHTRPDPPSIQEQEMDIQRQLSIKRLAQIADQRWASKPSLLDGPELQQQAPLEMKIRDPGGYAHTTTTDKDKSGVKNAVVGSEELMKKDPRWERRRTAAAPGEDWRPQVWDPNAGGTERT